MTKHNDVPSCQIKANLQIVTGIYDWYTVSGAWQKNNPETTIEELLLSCLVEG